MTGFQKALSRRRPRSCLSLSVCISGSGDAMSELKSELRRVYWETTAGCNLRCLHCRRVDTSASPDELTTEEGKRLIDELATFGRPALILSGGEPLFRKDIFLLASYACSKKLPVALSTNGTLVDEETAKRIKDSGIYYASISLDGANSNTHDILRGRGSFEKALKGFHNLKEAGVKTQINFTLTRRNASELPQMYDLACEAGACALYLFLFVPVGCGVKIAESQMLSPEEGEERLRWILGKEKTGSLPIKAICAPHYFRIAAENSSSLPKTQEESRKGCLAGIHMCFISHKGDVFPCGYLPISCGNVRKEGLRTIWEKSTLFGELRDPELLSGRCGICPFKIVCGGCRARAYFAHEDFLAEEPSCLYQP